MNELSDLISEMKDGGKIVLEHGGEYCVYAADAFDLSGIKCGGEKSAAAFLSNRKNVVIDGGGSALKIYGGAAAFVLIGCKNVRVKNLTADFIAEDGAENGAENGAEVYAAYIKDSENIIFENVRFRRFRGTGVYAENCKNVALKKTECLLKEGDGKNCAGFFRFENCKGKAIAESCVARAAGAAGDFIGVRGGGRCDLIVKNNYAENNAGRGVYYAAGGKAVVAGNTFKKTGGAALCARDCKEYGAAYVKKIVFENNVADGCGNAYEEKYSVAYFPTADADEKGGCKTADGKTVGKLVLKENHFFNPEDEEHRIYLAGVKKATFKNNSFDRPYKIERENVKKLEEKGDVAAEKCP
ncbi:MAG: right-handed parallel beta-helix repeat-containing protein [Candidatus Borkfalkiaceae bacterium]|nr:right-handed parallel beta-helix repeat-containing protein [Clostridia bacterium]MDY6223926.1 right-handed parallel beta-helix repeat-containing protein [Christensenellaceae bacterium]